MNLIVGVKKDAEAAITLGENFEIAGATLKHESIGSSKTKTYFVDAEGNALTGEAVVCKHTYGETPPGRGPRTARPRRPRSPARRAAITLRL